jgi:GntR family transcriptional regulator, transcriptional repressor for pyruvate dehydrogenase complex
MLNAAAEVRSALGHIPRTRVSAGVVQQLQALMHQGRLTVGDKLPGERELCDLLGVSRPALREALRLLEVMGYLRTDARRGTFVCATTPAGPPRASRPRLDLFDDERLFEELMDVRETVEPRLAALAAQQASADDIRELRRLHAEVGTHVLASDLAAFTRADLALHNGIADVARNRIFRQLLNDIQDLLLEMRQISLADLWLSRARITQREHLAVIDAIARQDEPGAARAMLEHFSGQRNAYANQKPGRR